MHRKASESIGKALIFIALLQLCLNPQGMLPQCSAQLLHLVKEMLQTRGVQNACKMKEGNANDGVVS